MLSYDIAKLERARAIKGWSKGQIARAVGITPATLSAIWKGQTKSAVTIKKIADVLNIPIEELILIHEIKIEIPEISIEAPKKRGRPAKRRPAA